jgi:hypothetical protein
LKLHLFARLLFVGLMGALPSSPASAFGVDVCYNAPDSGLALIANCIAVEEPCRTSNLIPPEEVSCRVEAMADSMSGLTGSNSIIGGRSLVHGDATYLMAQLIGYTPWQAYQVMIYNEASDQSDYVPFDQAGRQMLSHTQITDCLSAWGTAMARHCLLLTPIVNGLYKFNDESGGMLLHLHARFSPSGAPPPAIGFPADYLSTENARYEPLVNNLRDWAFNRRPDACVAGILARNKSGSQTLPRCEGRDRVIKSPQNFFAAGFSRLEIPFSSNLGTMIVHEDERGTVLASDRSFQDYIAPHQVGLAKLGVFLHAYADRFSHHMCTDGSWFQREFGGNYDSRYDSQACAQGSHFLWHVWEQGTHQDGGNLELQHQTMRPTLKAVHAQLVDHARLRGIKLSAGVESAALVDRLIDVLGIYDPQLRLNAMVALMEELGALPLPGHGSAADLSLDQWLDAAGAPRRLRR